MLLQKKKKVSSVILTKVLGNISVGKGHESAQNIETLKSSHAETQVVSLGHTWPDFRSSLL